MPAPLQDVPWTEIAIQAAAGVTLEELSEYYQVNLNTLRARSAREKWKQTTREVVSQRTGTKQVSDNTTMQQRATERGLGLMHSLKGKTKLHQAKTVYKTAKAFSKLPGEALMSRTQDVKNNVDSASKLWPEEQQSSPLIAIQLNGYIPAPSGTDCASDGQGQG